MADSLDLSALTGLEIRSLTQDAIASVAPEKFAALSNAKLNALTSTQLTWMTGAQWDALSADQKTVLFSRSSLPPASERPEVKSVELALPVVANDEVVKEIAQMTIASRFMKAGAGKTLSSKLAPLSEPTFTQEKPVAQVSASASPKHNETKTSSFGLTQTAVYVAVMTLLSSGDFLSEAHSHGVQVVQAAWSQSISPQTNVPEFEAHNALVMPPDSAVNQTLDLTVPTTAVAEPLKEVLAKAVDVPSSAQFVATVNVQTPVVKAKLHQDDVMCTAAANATPPKTALQEYVGEMSRQNSVISSLMLEKEREVLKVKGLVAQAPQPPQIAAESVAPKLTESVPQTAKSADPDRYNANSWTSISQATDLPPRIAALGEDLISVVVKELPSSKDKLHAMSFDEFKLRVKEAVVASPDVGIVSSQVGQSQAAKSLALSGMLPHVSGTADSGRRQAGRDPYLATSTAIDRSGTNYGFSISQLVYDFGASLSGVRAGEARVLAQKELLNSKKSEQALKTISAFVDLERARAQLKLAKQNANSRLAIVKLVKERSELGGGTKADIVRVESKYAEALSTISLMETRLSGAESAYREVFGATPKDIVNGPMHEFALEGLNKSAQELAESYPGMLQLARLRDASLEEYKSASAKSLPQLQMVYSNNLTGVNGPTVPTSDTPSRSTSTVLQLKYEFYTGGADTARKTDALYKSQQAWEEFQAGMRQYQKVLSQNQAEIRNNDDLIAARKASANSAIDSMRAVREQFSFNRGSLLDLITVQETLYQAGRDLIDATADQTIGRYRLLHLTAELDKMFDLGSLVSMNVKD